MFLMECSCPSGLFDDVVKCNEHTSASQKNVNVMTFLLYKKGNIYTHGQNCWYPSFNERKTHNGHSNDFKLTIVKEITEN